MTAKKCLAGSTVAESGKESKEMSSVETLLSNAEREFLARHQITASQVVDARGLSKQARGGLMRSRAAVLAIGSPCDKRSHRLRISPGHCAECDPKKIAFARRHRSPAQVYVASSSALTLTKIGSSLDANARIAQLNSERYGGVGDWRLVGMCHSSEAGRIESEAMLLWPSVGRRQDIGKLAY
jgi:hypothetical protein